MQKKSGPNLTNGATPLKVTRRSDVMKCHETNEAEGVETKEINMLTCLDDEAIAFNSRSEVTRCSRATHEDMIKSSLMMHTGYVSEKSKMEAMLVLSINKIRK